MKVANVGMTVAIAVTSRMVLPHHPGVATIKIRIRIEKVRQLNTTLRLLGRLVVSG